MQKYNYKTSGIKRFVVDIREKYQTAKTKKQTKRMTIKQK